MFEASPEIVTSISETVSTDPDVRIVKDEDSALFSFTEIEVGLNVIFSAVGVSVMLPPVAATSNIKVTCSELPPVSWTTLLNRTVETFFTEDVAVFVSSCCIINRFSGTTLNDVESIFVAEPVMATKIAGTRAVIPASTDIVKFAESVLPSTTRTELGLNVTFDAVGVSVTFPLSGATFRTK